MIRNCLFLSATALILIVLGLASRLNFLAASKKALFFHCGPSIALFLAVLGVNLFAATLAINRKLLLKDTGRKLSHFDNQLQAGSPEGLPPFLLERR
jgi:mannose/fructose/N-acetylgalactosamine-specific phosphotransferase system component IIC